MHPHIHPAPTTLLTVLACCLFPLSPSPAATTDVTWTGAAGNWSNPANWTPNVVPNNSPIDQFTAALPAGTVSLSANTSLNALTLAPSAQLLLSPNTQLAVSTDASATAYALAGQITLATNALLSLQGQPTLNNATITGPGFLHFDGDLGALAVLGQSSVDNLTLGHNINFWSNDFSHPWITGEGTLTLTSNASLKSATASINSIHAASSASVQLTGALFLYGSSFVNDGSLTMLVDTTDPSFRRVGISGGALINNGRISVTAGTDFSPSTFVNNGTLTLADSSSTSFNSLTLSASSQIINPAGTRLQTNELWISDSVSVESLDFGSIRSNAAGTVTLAKTSHWSSNGGWPGPTASCVTLNIPSGSFLSVGPSEARIDRSTLNNSGTITAAAITLRSASIVNDGLLSVTSIGNASELPKFDTGSVLLNRGLLTTSNLSTVSGTLDNRGSWASGGIASVHNLLNHGTLTAVGGSLTLDGGENWGSIISLVPTAFSGPFTLHDGSTLLVSSTMTLRSTLTVEGSHSLADFQIGDNTFDGNIAGPGTLTLLGGASWSAGTMTGSGATVISTDANFYAVGAPVVIDSRTFINGGFSFFGSNLSLANNATLRNLRYMHFGSITLSGTGTLDNANYVLFIHTSIHLPISNSGRILFTNGLYDLSAGYAPTSPAASLQFDTDAGLLFSGGNYDLGPYPLDLIAGSLKGSGSLRAQFSTTGPLLPTGALTLHNNNAPNSINKVAALSLPGSPGHWTALLDLTHTSLLVQPTANKDDALALLADQLLVGRANNFHPHSGITSSLVALHNATFPDHPFTLGLFDNADLHLASYMGQPLDDSSILIIPTLAGDANADHTVDLADYDLWYKNVGTGTGTSSRADFNLDTNTDLADYDAWYRNVGASYAGLTPQAAEPNLQPILPVPEPISLLLLAPLLPSLLRRRSPRSFASV